MYVVIFLFITSDVDILYLDFCSVPFVNCLFISFVYIYIYILLECLVDLGTLTLYLIHFILVVCL